MNIQSCEKYSVISLENNHPFDLACEIEEKVDSLINEGKTNFVMDFIDVNFFDSHILGILIRIHKIENIKLCLVNVDKFERTLEVLKLTGLDNYFKIFKSVEEVDSYYE